MEQEPVGAHVRVTLSLPPDALAKLDRIARSEGRSRSNAVARLISRVPEK